MITSWRSFEGANSSETQAISGSRPEKQMGLE
jgi:hypothetical protein